MPYIAYFYQGYPNEYADPKRFATVKETVAAFRRFAKDTGRDYYDPYGTANASVYNCHCEAEWETAMEFKGVGCPFDYPLFTLAIGKRAGVVREKC